jgi:hypothetical protein
MILYVNGCSHTAAAEAAVDHAFAEDDSRYHHLGRRAHPDNLAVSWCTHLARELKFGLICDAESASSNDRIIRTTTDWINNNPDQLKDVFIIIQWTTWEREEWYHQGTWYQVNASGIDSVPQELQEKYRNYIIGIDWEQKTLEAHDKIWKFHQTLANLKIPHLFYSSHSTFSDIDKPKQYNWGLNYMHPYNRELSYNSVLKNNGFDYANPKTYHYGADGHCFWGHNLLYYINNNNLIDANEICTD